MDHSNSADSGKFCQCPHGRCLNHNPEWENVSEIQEPNPEWFGLKKTYWSDHCCGKNMARYRVVQVRRCKKCGRIDKVIKNIFLALCLCCGYHRDNTPDYDSDD